MISEYERNVEKAFGGHRRHFGEDGQDVLGLDAAVRGNALAEMAALAGVDLEASSWSQLNEESLKDWAAAGAGANAGGVGGNSKARAVAKFNEQVGELDPDDVDILKDAYNTHNNLHYAGDADHPDAVKRGMAVNNYLHQAYTVNKRQKRRDWEHGQQIIGENTGYAQAHVANVGNTRMGRRSQSAVGLRGEHSNTNSSGHGQRVESISGLPGDYALSTSSEAGGGRRGAVPGQGMRRTSSAQRVRRFS